MTLEILDKDIQYKGDKVEYDPRGFSPGITAIAELNIKYSLEIEADSYGVGTPCNYRQSMFIPRVDYTFWVGEGTNNVSYYIYKKRELESLTETIEGNRRCLDLFIANPLGAIEWHSFEFLERQCRSYQRCYEIVNLIERVREARKKDANK